MHLSERSALSKKRPRAFLGRGGADSAFTLVEVILSLGIAVLMVGGLVTGYMQAVKVAEWSAYSLAANALALQGLEQTRAAKWDPRAYPASDQLVSANFPDRVEVLDIPISKTNLVYATNRTTIRMACTNPPLRFIQVDCTWTFVNRGVFTNTIFSFRAPDQ
jgi:type II secretory pathway pseudopilin PulG